MEATGIGSSPQEAIERTDAIRHMHASKHTRLYVIEIFTWNIQRRKDKVVYFEKSKKTTSLGIHALERDIEKSCNILILHI